jgi:phosphoglycerate dehydrogenase-like enzyme
LKLNVIIDKHLFRGIGLAVISWNHKYENKNFTRASELKEGLKSRLNEIGLVSEEVNINQPIIPQLSDVDVLVNGFIKINKLIIDASPKLNMVHQSGIGVDNVDVDCCTSKSIYVAIIPLAKNIKNGTVTHLYCPVYLVE